MKPNRLPMLAVLLWLGGCAGLPASEPVAGSLNPVWRGPADLEVTVDGVAYRGPWTGGACHTPECRGTFRNVLKYQRRLVTRGEAAPAAADGRRLDCRWARYREQLEGVCRTADGRVFRLVEGRD